jgi:hypothetical protein
MMCKKPFLRTPQGVKPAHAVISREARLAATPVGCGQCLFCRINTARIWTNRILLEQKTHLHSSFVTLTYDDDHLPDDNEIVVAHLQNFIKRLRNRFKDGCFPDYDCAMKLKYYKRTKKKGEVKTEPRFKRIRYYGVGEYGKETFRPHYHLALFGVGKKHERKIVESWMDENQVPIGFVYVGELNAFSARYIAGYIMDKMKGKKAILYCARQPPFTISSKHAGGIGFPYVKQLADSCKQYDIKEVITQVQHGKRLLPLGRYLIKKLAEEMNIDEETLNIIIDEHQMEMIEKHYGNKEIYYDSIVNEEKQKKLNMEKRYRIFEGRNKI